MLGTLARAWGSDRLHQKMTGQYWRANLLRRLAQRPSTSDSAIVRRQEEGRWGMCGHGELALALGLGRGRGRGRWWGVGNLKECWEGIQNHRWRGWRELKRECSLGWGWVGIGIGVQKGARTKRALRLRLLSLKLDLQRLNPAL